jgi:hypothetical protein
MSVVAPCLAAYLLPLPMTIANFVDTLTRGNVPQVKTLLASVALALAVYQLVLIAVAYGKVRLPVLTAGPAAKVHRASGDTIAVLLLVVAAMCLLHFGYREGAGFHALTGTALLAVLVVKVVVVRWWHGANRLLPWLGASIFVLLAVTWAGSAGAFL